MGSAYPTVRERGQPSRSAAADQRGRAVRPRPGTRRKSVSVDGIVDAGIWFTLIEVAKEHHRESVLLTTHCG
jgi:hypothetical protein